MSKFNLSELRFQNKFKNLFLEIGKIENYFTKNINIENPTFIFGSPRSGTSVITEILSKTSYYCSPYQKDLPFCTVPIFWNFFSKFYYGNKKEFRVHNPYLVLDKNSSDSYEEYIWKIYYENYPDFYLNYIDEKYIPDINPIYLKNFMKKIIYLRKKNFYLSKNNINILRIKFLNKIFPDAKFIFCIRNPLDTCLSQHKIHETFEKINEKEKILEYLKILGHYEFSETFQAYKIGKFEEVMALREKREHLESYLLQWINVNEIVLEKYLKNKSLRNKIYLIDFDTYYSNDAVLQKNLYSLSKFLEISINQIKEQYDIFFVKGLKDKIKNSYSSKNLTKACEIYQKILNS